MYPLYPASVGNANCAMFFCVLFEEGKTFSHKEWLKLRHLLWLLLNEFACNILFCNLCEFNVIYACLNREYSNNNHFIRAWNCLYLRRIYFGYPNFFYFMMIDSLQLFIDFKYVLSSLSQNVSKLEKSHPLQNDNHRIINTEGSTTHNFQNAAYVFCWAHVLQVFCTNRIDCFIIFSSFWGPYIGLN